MEQVSGSDPKVLSSPTSYLIEKRREKRFGKRAVQNPLDTTGEVDGGRSKLAETKAYRATAAVVRPATRQTELLLQKCCFKPCVVMFSRKLPVAGEKMTISKPTSGCFLLIRKHSRRPVTS